MARVGNVTFVPSSSGGATGLIPLDQIPQEVKDEVEEIYDTLKDNDGRMRVEFETEAEVKQYAAQVNSYCEQRPVELGGPIRFRRSPTRGLAKTFMDFRVTDRKDESEEAEETAEKATPAKRTRKAAKAA